MTDRYLTHPASAIPHDPHRGQKDDLGRELIARIREQMRHAENYVRPESGVVRFCILPTDLNALLMALEASQ